MIKRLIQIIAVHIAVPLMILGMLIVVAIEKREDK
jgi:hypothetical protein